MEIKELNLSNWKNHSGTRLELSKINIFTGGNGEGKSGIVDAAYLALSGDTPTKPVGEYIKTGTSEAQVHMKCSINGNIRETTKIIQDDKIKTEMMSTNAILEQIGVSKETMKTLVDTWFFVDQADGKIRKNVLSSVLVPRLDQEALIAFVKSKTQSYHTEHEEFINNNFDRTSSQKKSQIEILHKLAYDRRREARKEMTEKSDQINELQGKLDMFKDAPSEIDADTLNRTNQYSNLSSELSYVQRELNKAKVEYDEYSSKITKLREVHSQLESSIDTKVTAETVSNVQGKIDVLKSQIRGITNQISALENDSKESSKLSCPYFSEGCRYNEVKDDMMEIASNLKVTLEQKNKDFKVAEETLAQKSEAFSNVQKFTEISSMLSAAEQKLAGRKAVIDANEVRIKGIMDGMEALKKAGIIDQSMIDKQGAKAEFDVMKARKLVYEEDLQKLTNEIGFLESCVNLYSRNDTFSSLIGGAKELFINKLTEICTLLIPKFGVSVDDEMEITFSGVSINTLSKSEKFRVGIAIQTALAIASKIGVVIIDGADIVVDPTNIIECINTIAQYEEIGTLIATSAVDFTSDNKRSKAKINVTASNFKIVNGEVTKLPDLFGNCSW